VIDIIPDEQGRWLATCDCALWTVHDEIDAAWHWVLEHDCAPELSGPEPAERSTSRR
jgi:hypothetical protein